MKRVVADLAAAGRPKGCFGRLAAIFLPILLAGCNSLLTAGSPAPVATALGNAATAAPQKPSSDDNAGAEEHARIVAAYGGIYHDDRVEQSVARIVGRVVAASDKPEQSYRITILNAPAVNAFALPGGYLYVTRGLLALANDSSEVAAVLAHEIGHITANHAIERQNKARNALLVSRVVTDVLDDSSGKLALAASQRTLASFSRQQELEADAIGVRTIGKAGYDPYAAARFLNAMARYSSYRANLGVAVDKRPDFLATHPARRGSSARPASATSTATATCRESTASSMVTIRARATCATAPSSIPRSGSASRCPRASSSTIRAMRCSRPVPTARRCASTRSACRRIPTSAPISIRAG